MNTQSTPTIQSTRPTGLQVTGARLQIHAQNHPVGYAVYGAGLAGAGTIFLALLMAAPALADPTGAPGWVLVAIAASALAVALLTGFFAYLYARRLPQVEESDPVRYASARLQAFSGGLGPDPNSNRTARRMVDHLIHTASPSYAVAPFLVVALAVTIRPLAEVVGPGFEPWMLMQFTPIVVMLVAMVALYGSAKRKHAAVIAFRDEYDAA